VLYLTAITKQLSTCDDPLIIAAEFAKIGLFLESVAAANRLFSGQLGMNYNYLRQIDPLAGQEMQTQVERELLSQSTKMLALPEGMEPLIAAGEENQEQRVFLKKIKDLEAELEHVREDREDLREQLEEAGKSSNPAKTQMLAAVRADVSLKVAEKVTE
jgi:hypothetical protein